MSATTRRVYTAKRPARENGPEHRCYPRAVVARTASTVCRGTVSALAFAVAVACAAPGSNDAAPGDAGDSGSADSCVPRTAIDAGGASRCLLCRPGSLACADDGRSLHRCSTDGMSFAETTPCDVAQGQLCRDDACVNPCESAARTHSYEGCEFYAASVLNSTLGHSFAGTRRDDFAFSVALANDWPAAADVTLDGGGIAATIHRTIPPHSVQTIQLPWNTRLAEGGDRESVASVLARDGAVRIRSTLPVAAYQFSPEGFVSADDCDGPHCYSYSNDASLLLPVAALRRQYVVVSRATVRALPRGQTRWRASSGFVAIVGTSDSATDVTIRLRSRTRAGDDVVAGEPGAMLRQTLGRGDVLQLVSANDPTCVGLEPDAVHGDTFCVPVPAEDLTGSIVESSAPVAVFSGHDCAFVPYNRFACDHLEEQLFPVEALGREYVVPRTPPVAAEPNLLRIVATRAGTTIHFTPANAHPPTTLALPGDFAEFEQTESLVLSASEPVVVAQFLAGANYDTSTPGDRNGDPDMILIPPIAQARSAYSFVAAPGFPGSNVVVAVPQNEAVVVDGAEPRGVPVARVAGYDVWHIRVAAGAHRVSSVRAGVRFLLIVTGVALFTSYSFPGGLDLAAISPPL